MHLGYFILYFRSTVDRTDPSNIGNIPQNILLLYDIISQDFLPYRHMVILAGTTQHLQLQLNNKYIP